MKKYYFTLSEIARFLGCSKQYIGWCSRRNRFGTLGRIGNQVVVRKNALAAFIEKKTNYTNARKVSLLKKLEDMYG